MEIQKAEHPQNHSPQIFACLEHPQTPSILSFLTLEQSNVISFKSSAEDQTKKKQFSFDSQFYLNDKFKYWFQNTNEKIIDSLLKGQDQVVMVYGVDQTRKDRLIIGQSQNQGILMCLLGQLFKTCYKNDLEDKVTIKLSSSIYKNSKFHVGFVDQTLQPFYDPIQKTYLLGQPEIIVRNIKTALKIINMTYKHVLDQRDKKQQQSQNLVFTIKVEMDEGYSKGGNTNKYVISKLNIIKLANPCLINQANFKKNAWFVDLFNELQAITIGSQQTHQQEPQDQFKTYLMENVFKNATKIYNFFLIINKISSNDCLTAMKFNNYLRNYPSKPQKIILDLTELQKQKNQLQSELTKLYSGKIMAVNRSKNEDKQPWIQTISSNDFEILKILSKLVFSNSNLMKKANETQYEFAKILSFACSKLQKYISNEQIEDYYYSKKIKVQTTNQLQETIEELYQEKEQRRFMTDLIIKKINLNIVKIKESLESKFLKIDQVKQLKNMAYSRSRELKITQRLIQLYDTMTHHFIYQENQNFIGFLGKLKQQTQQKFELKIKSFMIEYRKQQKNTEKDEMEQKIIKSPPKQQKENKTNNKTPMKSFNKTVYPKKKAQIDQMQMMFTNTNVCWSKFNSNNRHT